MAKRPYYIATEHISETNAKDPYLRPAFALESRIRRLLWNFCWVLFYRTSPRPMHAWRAMLLRLFGAQMGPNCRFYPSSRIWAPWNLHCADLVAVADAAEIYNPAPIHCSSHAIVSQGAFLRGATHDFDDPGFPLLSYTSSFGSYSWICARAVVMPGVNIGEGAVLGLASVATRDLEAWGVYAGMPATKVKERKHLNSSK